MNNEQTDETDEELEQLLEIENLQDELDKLNEMKEAADNLLVAFGEFDRAFKDHDIHEWERWKAGGKSVSDEFVSMYPSVADIHNEILEGQISEIDENIAELQRGMRDN